nr:RNA-dependent RNA polymerase [Marmot picobirnavirus]
MPKNNVTSFINSHFYDQDYRAKWTKDGFDRLRTYLGNVAKGQPKIYTAPFAKGQSMDKILNDWMKTLVSIRDEWPSLWNFENDLKAKVGPLSVQLPLRERMEDVAHYYEDILLSSNPIDDQAMNAVIREYSPIKGLRLRSLDKTVDKMKKSTNSGNPFFTKRRNVIQDTIPCRTYQFTGGYSDVGMDLPNNEYFDACAVIGWRGQEGGPTEEDVKQRVVWMFPFAVNVNELQVYQPLIEAAQATNLVPAWVSMESVDKEVTRLFDTKAENDLVVCTDFSRFDQHFNYNMQDCAKTILASLLTPGKQSWDWIEYVFPIKYSIPLCWAVDTDVTPVFNRRTGRKEILRSEDCTYFQGLHGMASGSGGTNADETLVHRALQYEAAMHAGSELNPHSMCLGDDGILTYPGIAVDEVVKAYESHGQECNVSKQYAATQDCVYLRRWHHQNYRDNGVCVGVYSTCRALGRLRYLERFMDPEYWSPEMVALRQLSIIENCKWHPLREQFAQFCMERDKYRLGIDIPGFLENVVRIASDAIEHMPDFLGYTKTLQGEGPSGMGEWWIVNYLKSVR